MTSDILEGREHEETTLTTSNGCVAIVAMAPAEAAEKLCMPAEYAFGRKYAVKHEPDSCITDNEPTCLAFNTLVHDDEQAGIRCIPQRRCNKSAEKFRLSHTDDGKKGAG